MATSQTWFTNRFRTWGLGDLLCIDSELRERRRKKRAHVIAIVEFLSVSTFKNLCTAIDVVSCTRSYIEAEKWDLFRSGTDIISLIHGCESLELLEMVAKDASISPNSDTLNIRNRSGR
jgi:hypothetical protein